eukprot:3168376-Rhodomonas_salina.1
MCFVARSVTADLFLPSGAALAPTFHVSKSGRGIAQRTHADGSAPRVQDRGLEGLRWRGEGQGRESLSGKEGGRGDDEGKRMKER